MAEGYLKRDTVLKMMHQYDGQQLYDAILYTEDADVRENIHGHIMETYFSDHELFKCSECGRRFFMQKSYGIYKACPFCMAIFDNEADMRDDKTMFEREKRNREIIIDMLKDK